MSKEAVHPQGGSDLLVSSKLLAVVERYRFDAPMPFEQVNDALCDRLSVLVGESAQQRKAGLTLGSNSQYETC